MSNQKVNDQALLVDFLRGELTEQKRSEVVARLDRDDEFRKTRDDIVNTFKAIDLAPELDPPEQLVKTTVARIAQARQTEALLAKEEARRRPLMPTMSLRELAGVAAAVLLIASVLIPSVRHAHQLQLAGRCSANVGQIGAGLLAYANDNDDYLPSADGPRSRWLAAPGADAFSNSAALYKLIRLGYVPPTAFRCPAVSCRGTFRATADMHDFPKGEFISYSYQHSRCPRPLRRSIPNLVTVADKMVILGDSTPLFADGQSTCKRMDNTVSRNHGRRGQNVLYLDMHVSWAKSADVGVGGNNIFLIDGIKNYRGDETPSLVTDTFLLPTFSTPCATR